MRSSGRSAPHVSGYAIWARPLIVCVQASSYVVCHSFIQPCTIMHISSSTTEQRLDWQGHNLFEDGRRLLCRDWLSASILLLLCVLTVLVWNMWLRGCLLPLVIVVVQCRQLWGSPFFGDTSRLPPRQQTHTACWGAGALICKGISDARPGLHCSMSSCHQILHMPALQTLQFSVMTPTATLLLTGRKAGMQRLLALQETQLVLSDFVATALEIERPIHGYLT